MSGEGQRESANERLGAQVRSLRDKRGMPQTELARLMAERGWPWHQSTVYRVETGKQTVSFAEAVDLAAILRTSTDRFTWGTAEANETDFTYMIRGRLRRRYEEVADAACHHMASATAADNLLSRPPGTDSPRVQEARRDLAETLRDCYLDAAVEEGVRRYEERTGEEEDGAASEEESPARAPDESLLAEGNAT